LGNPQARNGGALTSFYLLALIPRHRKIAMRIYRNKQEGLWTTNHINDMSRGDHGNTMIVEMRAGDSSRINEWSTSTYI
jgi:hypothetical protein